jgi:chromosomal replication initiator protein
METNDLPQIWDRLIDKLSHVTSESNMNMYIRQITPVKLENDVLCCTVSSNTLCLAIQQNFLSIILSALTSRSSGEHPLKALA